MSEDILNDTKESLERMQSFDAKTLERSAELGKGFRFDEAVGPASDLIRLYKQLAISVLSDFPNNSLSQIKKQADADFSRFTQILEFDPTNSENGQNPTALRQSYLDQLAQSYQQAFQVLHPFISYGVSKSIDSQRMETEARALLQSIKDEASAVTESLQDNQAEAQQVLEDVRKVAAEQGVSQQASYFKEEAEDHRIEARFWCKVVIALVVVIALLAIGSLFVHKIPFLAPSNTAEAIQLIASKVILFAVVGYMLVLSSKSFLSHKHNAVVNKHRQNALMTFNALVDAAKESENKEVILTHASACIFTPQDTGYIKSASTSGQSSGISVADMIPRTVVRTDSIS